MSLAFFTNSQISPRQAMTPEGFLLCSDVPAARTGELYYAAGEIPVEPNKNGIITITRDASEVFRPEAILSAAGKPVTNDHPPEEVTPANYRKYGVGVMLNPRRGNGGTLSKDYLYVDLLIQDAKAIADVREGKREVSIGYNADYSQIEPGLGRQSNIIINHCALVEKGRCGPSCAIGDSGSRVGHLIATTGDNKMSKRRPAWQDRVITAFKTGDEEALVDELEKVGDMMGKILSGVDEAPPGITPAADPHHIVVNVHGGAPAPAAAPVAATPDASDVPTPAAPAATPPVPAAAAPGAGGDLASLSARVDRLEQAIAILVQAEGGEEEGAGGPDAEPDANGDNDPADAGNGDKEEDRKPKGFDSRAKSRDRASTGDARALTGDSSGLRRQFTEAVARAEYLVPGATLPTFDAKIPAAHTFDTLCSFRRNILSTAWKTAATHDAIRTVYPMATGDFSKLSCDTAMIVFNAASELRRQANNTSVGRSMVAPRTAATHHDTSNMVAQINEANRKKYGVVA